MTKSSMRPSTTSPSITQSRSGGAQASTENMAVLSVDELRALLEYSPETGEFTWLVSTSRARRGYGAGSKRFDGRSVISINGRRYMAHRLAWLWMTGRWPDAEIDHINRDPTDNRWANLRQATRGQNAINVDYTLRKRDLPRGVHRASDSRCLFTAVISINGRNKHLGRFSTVEEASAAYLEAAAKRHGEFLPALAGSGP